MVQIQIRDKKFNVEEVERFKSYIKLVKKGEWEPFTFKIFDAFLDDAHSYIDLGAWIGITTLYSCQIANHCYAVEPDPVALKYLKGNIALNPELQNKITVSDVCIYHADCQVKLGNRTSLTGGDSESSVCFLDAPLIWEVTGMTLEHFFQKYQIEDCNFIKMDIEGAERTVLPSMAEILAKHKPTLFVAIHPLKFGEEFDEALLGIIEVLNLYEFVFTAEGLKIPPTILLNEGLRGPSYELVATDVPLERLRLSEWGKGSFSIQSMLYL